MSLPYNVPDGWTLAVAASNQPNIRIAFYPNGEARCWHTCVPAAPDIAIVCAPLLSSHTVTRHGDPWTEDYLVSVEPSIHCLRCGLHGFFRDNIWTPA